MSSFSVRPRWSLQSSCPPAVRGRYDGQKNQVTSTSAKRWASVMEIARPGSHRTRLGSRFGVVGSQRMELEVSRDLRISPTRNRSVSNARRWTEALRLSTNCELIEGCAKTNSMAARESRVSRSSTAKNA
jgi:hypothetical protein